MAEIGGGLAVSEVAAAAAAAAEVVGGEVYMWFTFSLKGE